MHQTDTLHAALELHTGALVGCAACNLATHLCFTDYANAEHDCRTQVDQNAAHAVLLPLSILQHEGHTVANKAFMAEVSVHTAGVMPVSAPMSLLLAGLGSGVSPGDHAGSCPTLLQ